MKVIVIPFRVEEITPSQELEYYLKCVQWLDAFTIPFEKHLQELVEHVNVSLPQNPPVMSAREVKHSFVIASTQTINEAEAILTSTNTDELEQIQQEDREQDKYTYISEEDKGDKDNRQSNQPRPLTPEGYAELSPPTQHAGKFKRLLVIPSVLIISIIIFVIVYLNKKDVSTSDSNRNSAVAKEQPLQIAAQHADTAKVFGDQGKPVEAESEWKQAISLEPNNPVWHVGFGDFLLTQGKDANVKAESEFREAIRLEPNNIKAHIGLTYAIPFETRQGEVDKERAIAVNLARELVQSEPNNAKAFMILGDALESFSEQETAYKKAVELDPTNAEVRDNLSFLYWVNDKLDKAEVEARAAVRLAPNVTKFHRQLVHILLEQKKYLEAEIEARASVRLAPHSSDSHELLANALETQRKYTEAEAEYEKAIQLTTDNGRINSYKEGLQELRAKMKKTVHEK